MHIKGTSYSKISICLRMAISHAQHSSTFLICVCRNIYMICGRNHPDEISMVLWKLGLVALQAAGTEILVVGGLAQWLCVKDYRWQRKSLLHIVASHACHVKIVRGVQEVTLINGNAGDTLCSRHVSSCEVTRAVGM